MLLTELRFKKASAMMLFLEMVGGRIVEINKSHLTLTCECSKEEIQYAIEKLEAEVVDSSTKPK